MARRKTTKKGAILFYLFLIIYCTETKTEKTEKSCFLLFPSSLSILWSTHRCPFTVAPAPYTLNTE